MQMRLKKQSRVVWYGVGPTDLLQRVDADVAGAGDVGVVDPGQEEAAGRGVGEVLAQHQLHVEGPAHVGRVLCLFIRFVIVRLWWC